MSLHFMLKQKFYHKNDKFMGKKYKKTLKIRDFQGLKWRRKRDLNPRAFWPNGFQGV